MADKIRFLHIVKDDKKFFESVLRRFEEDNRTENRCVLIVNNRKSAFQSIEPTDKIQVLCGKEMVRKRLAEDNYDAIFFYSLPYELWYVVSMVPPSKKVIWWSWGYELYEPIRGLQPLLPVNLYQGETLLLNKKLNNNLVYRIKRIVKKFTVPYYKHQLKKMLKRIDYHQPVIKEEYDLLRKNYPDLFRAKEFYYPNSWGKINPISHIKAEKKYILFGNSSSATNNHIDVWKVVSNFINEDQVTYVPLNYGDLRYADLITPLINGGDIRILRSFLPLEEYNNITDHCLCFISGVMRQQAVGNILSCIIKGVKILLYKDSMLYKSLERIGISVYSIEDMNSQTISTSMLQEEYENNIIALNKEIQRRNSIYESVFKNLAYNLTD